MIRRFLRDETGATAIEYGLLVTIFSIGLVSAFNVMGTSIRQKFLTLATTILAS